MANVKISELPTAASIAATSKVPAVVSGVTKQAPVSLIVPFINAKHYGATGDGVTDDTAAINAAKAALPSTGGYVFLPGGTYLITSSITLARYQGLIGQGSGSATGTSGATQFLKRGTFDGIVVGNYDCILRDFAIRGDVGNGGDGIYVRYGHCNIINVTSNDNGGVGWRFGDKTTGSANTNHCSAIDIGAVANTSHGIYLHDANTVGGPNVNACLFENIDSRNNGGDGVRLESIFDSVFNMASCQANTGQGIRLLSGAKGNYFYSPYTETNTAGTILIDAGTVENTFFGSRQGTSDSYTDNGTRNTIVGRDNSKQGNLIWREMWARSMLASTEAFTGRLRISQTASDQYDIAPEAGNITASVRVLNTAGGSAHLQVLGEIRTNGDTGGLAGYNSYTGTSDVTANSSGVGTILFKGITSRNSAGFIRVYIGTTSYHIPVFSAITG